MTRAELVLLTGAGGYVGHRLARHYLQTSDAGLLLVVRSRRQREAMTADLGALARRVEFVAADLDSPEPFAALDPSRLARVTSIVHAAAVTRFNVERSLAFRVNVQGTARVLDVASRCPALESFGHVSTVYATGLREGLAREQLAADKPCFANAYEESKWAAEQLVGAADDIPWRILRVATVLADDHTGAVTRYNAVHDTLKLCFYGLLSLLPGRADTPLYFVTGEFVARAITDVMRAPASGGVYHVAHTRPDCVTLQSLIELAFEQFAAADDFCRKRILPPLLADEESFSLLVDGISPIAGSLVSSALRDMAPFARQLYVCKDVDNTRLREALDSYQTPDAAQLAANACADLVRTRWGRRNAVA